MIEEMKKLVKQLNEYRDAYYNRSESLISDHQYDDLYDKLEQMEKVTGVVLSGSPTREVGYEVKSKLKKVVHSHLMMSLDKTKDTTVLQKFIGNKDSVLMCKMDGLTCLLTYENGELIRAETRGNGEIGEDITHNAKVFENIPTHIGLTRHVEIEGEAIITYEDFEKINSEIKKEDEKYKNPRNLASGSVRQLDSKIAANRHIRFVVWKVPAGMDELPAMISRLEKAREIGFDIVPYIHIYKEYDIDECINLLKDKAAYLSYPIDGLVVTYNDIAYGLSLGITDKFPRHSLAFKFYNEEYITTLINIEWQVGKTGIISPIAVFEPIEIEGSIITKASLFNLSILKEKLGNPYVGQKLWIIKANQVIPYITKAEMVDDKWII